MTKYCIALFVVFSNLTVFAYDWNGRVFRGADRTEIPFYELMGEVQSSKIVIMGENHTTPEVQNIQAKIIDEAISLRKQSFALAWEFLAKTRQPRTEELLAQLKAGGISYEEFIRRAVGSSKNNTYIPVLKKVLDLGGSIYGINLTREEKSPITQGGIKSADPKLVPPGYEIGGDDYFERFSKEMEGHVPAEKIGNYFDAQCLTDDVMAFHTLALRNYQKIFLIAGHFHTDYYDGLVQRLNQRAPNTNKLLVRIVDASEFVESELFNLFRHPKYGQLTDYVVFVNEPKDKGK